MTKIVPAPSPSAVPLIGGVKMSDFAPLTAEQVDQLRGPIRASIEGGMDPNEMAALPFGLIAQFFSTIDALRAQAQERPVLNLFGQDTREE